MTIALMSPSRATAGLTLFPISSAQRSTCSRSAHVVRCCGANIFSNSETQCRWYAKEAQISIYSNSEKNEVNPSLILPRPFTCLDDLDIGVKPRGQTEMQNPVQPRSKQKHNVGLQKSSERNGGREISLRQKQFGMETVWVCLKKVLDA